MKKFLSIILSLAMIFTLSITAFAAAPSENQLSQISDGFGIPMDVLADLNSETIRSLYEDVSTNKFISASDSYIKIITQESGEVIMREGTYAEYLRDMSDRVNNTDESSGWMKFHTTVYEVNSTTGLASCAFTWLTPPTPRMTDVIGVSMRNGTTQYNTTKGFYRHSSPNDNYEYTFQAKDIRESGEGATAKFKLRLSDYTYDTNDFVFLSLNFTKEGNSEGVNGSYAHQKVSITFSPSFSIDRVGKISLSGGFNIVSYYVQDTGYVSINW